MSFLEMSLKGSVLIIFILIIRKIALHKLPKVTFVILWGLAIFRLLLPLKVEFNLSFLSLFEKRKTVDNFLNKTNASQSDLVEFMEEVTFVSSSFVGENLYFLIAIYLIGFLLVSSFFIFLYLFQLKRFENKIEIFSSVKENNLLLRDVRVYKTYFTKTPLTYGVFKPKILLPLNFDVDNNENLSYVYKHEYTHIKHFDAFKENPHNCLT